MVAAWPSAWPAVPDAVSASERETMTKLSRFVFNATRRLLSLPRGAHAWYPTWREAPARPIGAPREGAGTGLPVLLLGSKRRRRFFERVGVSPN